MSKKENYEKIIGDAVLYGHCRAEIEGTGNATEITNGIIERLPNVGHYKKDSTKMGKWAKERLDEWEKSINSKIDEVLSNQ